MKVTWDREANAAYIRFVDSPAAYTLTVDKDGATVATMDFGEGGELLGVELLDAANQLPRDLRTDDAGESDGR